MLLKNLMEDKQLDFNRPLLSVRRFTSQVVGSESEGNKKTDKSLSKIPRLPIYKSELKSGPIRNPGTVPFMWEKTPGRPKEEKNIQTRALDKPPVAPKLPPGRTLNGKQQPSIEGSDAKTFAQWQTEIVPSSSKNVSSLDLDETQYACTANGDMEETRSSGSKDSGEAYVDALDTLSRSESFFLNCSVSGLSELDGSDMKPSGIFSSDPQTRDFMMGRFLPAAKAVASETPPYATRKQSIVRETPKQIKELVMVHKKQQHRASIPKKLQHYAQDDWLEETEDDCYRHSDNFSANVCGLFPRFLLKNSCLLNPVQGMKIQAQKSVEPAYSVRRREAKSSYLRPCSKTENEHAEAASEKGLTGIAPTEEVIEDKHNQGSGSSKNSYRSDRQNPDGAPPFRLLQGNNVSSPPGQISQFVHQEKGFLGIPEKAKNYRVSSIDPLKKESKNFKELLASENISQESHSASPVEKTLYVDSIHRVASSSSCFPDETALTQCMKDDFEILVNPGEMEENSSIKDSKHLNHVVDENAAVQHKTMESVYPYSLFSPEKHGPCLQMDASDGTRRDRALIQDSSKLTCPGVAHNMKNDMECPLNFESSQQEHLQYPKTFTHSTAAEHRKVDSESRSKIKSSNRGSSSDSNSKLPLSLPLPKAPSESWLKRTLPAVSSRNTSSWSSLGTSNGAVTQANTTPSSDLKWETIVRSSNVHHGRMRFSEEQLPPIPEA